MFDYLWPIPQKISASKEAKLFLSGSFSLKGKVPRNFKAGLKELGCKTGVKGLRVEFKISSSYKPEAYKLIVSASGILIRAGEEKGFFYAAETLLQMIAYSLASGKMPFAEIEDRPAHKIRAFMVDLGRTTYSLKYLKRIVRIMARLKMNALHVHLFDDQLFGIKLKNLPLGTENPAALTLSEFKELNAYAGRYYIEIIPEIEAWGHVGSIVYHYPEIKGGPGMYGSTSFLISEQTLKLVENITSQIVGVMPKKGIVHLGMDEANWYPSKEKSIEGMDPAKLVGVYSEMLERINKKQKKNMRLCIWADHGGRPVPEKLKKKIIISPWNYWIRNKAKIEKAAKFYGGKGKADILLGAGMASEAQQRGAYDTTKLWATLGMKYPNILGVDVTYWGVNDIPLKLLSVFASFGFCWNPVAKSIPPAGDYETFDQYIAKKLLPWQLGFKDGRMDALLKDMGEIVWQGFYLTGKNCGKAAAITAEYNKTGYFGEV